MGADGEEDREVDEEEIALVVADVGLGRDFYAWFGVSLALVGVFVAFFACQAAVTWFM